MKNSSPRALAQFVDRLTAETAVSVSENSSSAVTISGLTGSQTGELVRLVTAEGWSVKVVDGSEFAVPANALDDGLEPFWVSFDKPSFPEGPAFLGVRAFQSWLQSLPSPGEANAGLVARVATSTVPFRTQRVAVGGWDDVLASPPYVPMKSPRALVRTIGEATGVPLDVGAFLLREADLLPWGDIAFAAWVNAAYPALVLALAGEVEPARLLYLGPPRVTLTIDPVWPVVSLGSEGFLALQAAAAWVYELSAAAELRHRLFVHEFARLASSNQKLGEAIAASAAIALEGARITYQYGLSEQSKDALKSLSDLRKSVMEETVKITETARQLALNTAGALFYGLGLLAGKLVTTLSPWVLDAMAIVGGVYLGAIAATNYRFLKQQPEQRTLWRQKIYRYLTDREYNQLVRDPLCTAEHTAKVVVWVAIVLGCIMVAGVLINDHTDAFLAPVISNK